MPYVYKEVEVEIDLSDFSDDDLIEELKSRSYGQFSNNDKIISLYEAYKLNQTDKFEKLLKEFFYDSIGRIA